MEIRICPGDEIRPDGLRRHCVVLEPKDYVNGEILPQSILTFARERQIVDAQPNSGSVVWILYPDYQNANAYTISWIGACINLGVPFGFEGPLYYKHIAYAA